MDDPSGNNRCAPPRPEPDDDANAWRVPYGDEEIALVRIPSGVVGEHRQALTAAEEQIVDFVAQGMSNVAIARARGTSVRTVANQLASIYRKLDICSRHELLVLVSRGSEPPAEPTARSTADGGDGSSDDE